MIKNICLILISLISYTASAQYTFINYSSRNGLASNSINAIIRDKYGFMWFGTEDGLNRFDG
ncbi:MAG TPA: two-component regulator propeller domain-containing protein, partial [Cyclobacteriaceae bacterium]|nr:two-component regulator propeller domain-containing protein [Cyclobacteriaceae bacterium]